MIAKEVPCIEILRPMTFRSAEKVFVQKLWLTTATGAPAGARSSSGRMVRPICGAVPSIAKYEPETSMASIWIGVPSTTAPVELLCHALVVASGTPLRTDSNVT